MGGATAAQNIVVPNLLRISGFLQQFCLIHLNTADFYLWRLSCDREGKLRQVEVHVELKVTLKVMLVVVLPAEIEF